MQPMQFQPAMFRAFRHRLELSVEALARKMGCSAFTIYNWEHGRARPSAERLATAAAILGASQEDFFIAGAGPLSDRARRFDTEAAIEADKNTA